MRACCHACGADTSEEITCFHHLSFFHIQTRLVEIPAEDSVSVIDADKVSFIMHLFGDDNFPVGHGVNGFPGRAPKIEAVMNVHPRFKDDFLSFLHPESVNDALTVKR